MASSRKLESESCSSNPIILPPLHQLPRETRELILALQNLLGLHYQELGLKEHFHVKKYPRLLEVAKILIGCKYHAMNCNSFFVDPVLIWLELSEDNIPSRTAIYQALFDPLMQQFMASHGVMEIPLPQINFNNSIPDTEIHILTEKTFYQGIESNEQSFHLFEIPSIVQARFEIQIERDILSTAKKYHATFFLGRKNAPSHLPDASLPFFSPVNMIALISNAKGAASFSFADHLNHLITEFNPDIIIITETREGLGEGNQMGVKIEYPQVMASSPIGFSGGVWIFSNMKRFTFSVVENTLNEMKVNFLTV